MEAEWKRAIEKKAVFIVPGGAQHWHRVEREDQQRELRRWARGEPREKGWLVLQNGVPSHFLKSNGSKEPLKIEGGLSVVGYNILTSTEDGDPNELSVYEYELHASGKYRYWKNRVDNVARALRSCDVAGLCEATTPMLHDLVTRCPHLRVVSQALKPGNYDGSAILVNHERVEVQKTVKGVLESGMAQVLLASLLKDKASGDEFWCVVLHLKSDGSGAHGGKEMVRVGQAKRALKRIDALTPRRPVVVVGDLNSDRFLYPAFEEKGRPHVLQVFHEFESALPLKPTYHHWERAAFDHILLRGAVAVDAHVPDSGGTAPNKTQGSDHLPVKATIVFQ